MSRLLAIVPIALICATCILLAACRDAAVDNSPTPFPTSTIAPSPSPIPSPTATGTPPGTVAHTFATGDFALLLPAKWSVAEQGLTVLGYHYLLGPEPIDPGPFSSAIFVADIAAQTVARTPASFAEALLCGRGCADDIELEETTIAGEPALIATLDHDGVALNWYFLEHANRLLVFSLHDPVTLSDRADLLATISFGEASDGREIESEEVTPTPMPTLEPVRSWRRIVPETIELTFEVPATWVQDAGALAWRPSTESDQLLDFEVNDLGGETFDATEFIPENATVEAAGALQLDWTGEAISYTLSLPESSAVWVMLPVGEQVIVFSAEAPDRPSRAPLLPILNHVLASVRLGFVLEEFIPEPNEAAIGLFQALISDPDGDEALSFLSPALRSQIPAGESPATLLQLSDAILQYNLDWAYITDDTVLVTVQILLADGSALTRELLAVNLDELGWRIDAVTIPAPNE